MNFASGYGAPPPTAPKRNEVRVPATLNVRVLGIDSEGKTFHQSATTVDISLSGARINGLTAKLNPGDVVGLQSGGGKSRFKVAWVAANRDGSYMLGLQCVEKGACPWRENLQPPTEVGDRRTYERYPCNGSVSLRSATVATPIWGSLRDVSIQGCYVQCVNVVPPGSILSGQFTINGVQISAIAEVCNSLQAVGMGLRWCDLGCDGQEKLDYILHSLEQDRIDEKTGQAKALSLMNRLHQLVSTLRDRLEGQQAIVHAETLRELTEAQEILTAALKSIEMS